MVEQLLIRKPIDSFCGTSGHTGDREFDILIESLGFFTVVVDEEEEYSGTSELVTEYHREQVTGVVYQLWYQVRTPESPEGMEFAFGFDRAS